MVAAPLIGASAVLHGRGSEEEGVKEMVNAQGCTDDPQADEEDPEGIFPPRVNGVWGAHALLLPKHGRAPGKHLLLCSPCCRHRWFS